MIESEFPEEEIGFNSAVSMLDNGRDDFLDFDLFLPEDGLVTELLLAKIHRKVLEQVL